MGNEFNGKGTMCGCGSGGSGGTPADYEELKNQVATNTADIADLKEDIQTMRDDDCYYMPIKLTEALILKGAKYIDTGLKMDGKASLSAVGALPDTTKQAVLIGAYKSNSERTVLKILGQSHKIQSQWAGNVETTAEQVAEMDFSSMFEYYQNSRQTTFYCSGKSISISNTGFTGADDETPLLLFNQTKSGDFNNGALHGANVIPEGDRAISFIGARKHRKSDMSFVGYAFIMLYGSELFIRELPLPDGAYFELYEMQQ